MDMDVDTSSGAFFFKPLVLFKHCNIRQLTYSSFLSPSFSACKME